MFGRIRNGILIGFGSCMMVAACGGSNSNPAPPPAPPPPPLQPLGTVEDTDPADNILSESSNAGAAVGITLSASNPNPGAATTYALVDDAGGLFTVDASSGVVTLTGALDFETSASHQIVAEARSGTAASPLQTFDIAVTDSPAPDLSVLFPLPGARFSDALMPVTGTVNHPQLENITVTARAGANPLPAIINPDGTFVVPLVLILTFGPVFDLEVIASHPGGESDSMTLTLGAEPEIASLAGLALDPVANRLVGVDRYTLSVITIDIATGMRRLVSGPVLGGGPLFDEPDALTLNPANGIAYVVGDDGMYGVDLRSGRRALLSASGVGNGPALCRPTGAAFFAASNSVLVSDDCRKDLLMIDVVTGDREAVTDSGAGPVIPSFQGVTYDPATNRAIVLSASSDEIYAVDMATRERTRLDDGSMQSNSFANAFADIAVDSTGQTAYLSDDFGNALVAIDLAAGTRRTVSTSGIFTDPAIGSGPLFEFPAAVAIDESANRVIVAEEEFGDALIAVDLATGNRSIVGSGRRGTGMNYRGPQGLATTADRSRYFVADFVADSAVEVDLASGDRQLIFGNADGRGTIDTAPIGIAADPDNNLIYVVDITTSSMSAVSMLDGSSTVIADATTGTGVALQNPYDIVLQTDLGRALVLDQGLDALISVDLASGDRTFVPGGMFGQPVGIDLTADGSVAYVADAGDDAVYRLDLISGDKTEVTSSLVGPVPRINSLADVVFDEDAGQLYVVDTFPPRVIAIDPVTGVRTVLSENSPSDRGVYFARPERIELGPNDQVLLVMDRLHAAMIAVSTLTGDRQLLSK